MALRPGFATRCAGPVRAALAVAVVLAAFIPFAAAQTPKPAAPPTLLPVPPANAPAATPLPPAQQQQLPQVGVIRAGITVVDIPVIVLDKKGQPIDTFGRDDFHVTDDGRIQRISGFDKDPRPLSLAIVIDINDPDAIGQAKRSAELISAMVVGSAGTASIFVAGAEPRQILPFTSDTNQIADTLKHLTLGPTAALGKGGVTEPLNLAILQLRRQSSSNTRAALVISKSTSRSGALAEALVESAMNEAIPIFHLSPNRPKDADDLPNPISPDQRGTGVGSQRAPMPVAPVDSRGNPAPAGTGNMDLGPVIRGVGGAVGHVLQPHNLDYVYDSGGIDYSASNDREFDQKMSLIGDELRSIYHLYYQPNDLTPQPSLHSIDVRLDAPSTASVGSTTYRRTYVGVAQHP